MMRLPDHLGHTLTKMIMPMAKHKKRVHSVVIAELKSTSDGKKIYQHPNRQKVVAALITEGNRKAQEKRRKNRVMHQTDTHTIITDAFDLLSRGNKYCLSRI